MCITHYHQTKQRVEPHPPPLPHPTKDTENHNIAYVPGSSCKGVGVGGGGELEYKQPGPKVCSITPRDLVPKDVMCLLQTSEDKTNANQWLISWDPR